MAKQKPIFTATFQNLNDLLTYFGANSVEQLERQVYKANDCGPWLNVSNDQKTVNVGTIVEGSPAEIALKLRFPFTLAQWNKAFNTLEKFADLHFQEGGE